MKLFSIKDIKAGTFGRPMEGVNNVVVMRELGSVVNGDKDKTILAKYPEDFQLYAVGEFNVDTAAFDSKLEFVCNLNELVVNDNQ